MLLFYAADEFLAVGLAGVCTFSFRHSIFWFTNYCNTKKQHFRNNFFLISEGEILIVLVSCLQISIYEYTHIPVQNMYIVNILNFRFMCRSGKLDRAFRVDFHKAQVRCVSCLVFLASLFHNKGFNFKTCLGNSLRFSQCLCLKENILFTTSVLTFFAPKIKNKTPKLPFKEKL